MGNACNRFVLILMAFAVAAWAAHRAHASDDPEDKWVKYSYVSYGRTWGSSFTYSIEPDRIRMFLGLFPYPVSIKKARMSILERFAKRNLKPALLKSLDQIMRIHPEAAPQLVGEVRAMYASGLRDDILKTVIEIREHCTLEDGTEKEAVALMHRPGTPICLSLERIYAQQKWFSQAIMHHMTALLFHEFVHHFGYADEDHVLYRFLLRQRQATEDEWWPNDQTRDVPESYVQKRTTYATLPPAETGFGKSNLLLNCDWSATNRLDKLPAFPRRMNIHADEFLRESWLLSLDQPLVSNIGVSTRLLPSKRLASQAYIWDPSVGRGRRQSFEFRREKPGVWWVEANIGGKREDIPSVSADYRDSDLPIAIAYGRCEEAS